MSAAKQTPESVDSAARHSLRAATGWGAWVQYAWNPEEPECVRCGTGLSLSDGCEWHDWPELNMCHDCLTNTLEEDAPQRQAQPRRENH